MLREAKLGIMIAMQMKDLSSYESGDVLSERRYINKFILRFFSFSLYCTERHTLIAKHFS